MTTRLQPPFRPTLLSIPSELLLLIAENLEYVADVSSLLCTNRCLSHLLTPLLHRHASKDRAPLTALQWAASKGHNPLIKHLLSTGADPNRKLAVADPSHLLAVTSSALHFAVIHGNINTIALLLDHGATVNARDLYQKTPLYVAVCNIHADGHARPEMPGVVRLLLERGADPTAENSLGVTPLHVAAQRAGDVAAVMGMLLDWGGQVDHRDVRGETPLHLAALVGTTVGVRVLVERGANVDARNRLGRTPLQVARLNWREEVVELLVAKGAFDG